LEKGGEGGGDKQSGLGRHPSAGKKTNGKTTNKGVIDCIETENVMGRKGGQIFYQGKRGGGAPKRRGGGT